MAAFTGAAVSVGPAWLLMRSMDDLPGLLSDKPGRGISEVSMLLVGAPANQLLLMTFLCVWLAGLLVLGLRPWADPQGHVFAALCWAFGSPSLNLATVAWCLGVLAAAWCSLASSIVMSLSVALALALPFASGSAETLRRPRLQRWWRLRWPGRTALVLAVSVWLTSVLSGWLADWLWQAQRSTWGAWMVIDAIGFALAGCLVAVAWIEQARLSEAWASFRRLMSWPRLRVLLWEASLYAITALWLSLPILTAALVMIFAIPPYQSWADDTGQALPWSLQALVQTQLWLGSSGSLLFALSGFGGWIGFQQGRLLVSLGVAEGKQAA